MAERDPDIERLDREHARTRAEVKQLWETVGSTREEMAAVKSSVDGITHEMRDFRTEMRNSVVDLSTASKKLTESVLHTEGSRSGAHSTVKIVLTTIGLTLTVAIVAIGVLKVVMA